MFLSKCVCLFVLFCLFCLFWDDNSTVDSTFAEAMAYLSEELETGRRIWYWKDSEVFGLYLDSLQASCECPTMVSLWKDVTLLTIEFHIIGVGRIFFWYPY